MNIAIFTDYYLPSLGGTQVSIRNQKEALEKSGHSVTIITAGPKPKVPEKDVIYLSTLPFVSIEGRGFVIPWPSISREARNVLLTRNIQVVHAQTDFTVGNLGLKLAKQLNLPSVYTLHTKLWKQIEVAFPVPRFLTWVCLASIYLYWRVPAPKLRRDSNESYPEHGMRRVILASARRVELLLVPSEFLKEEISSWGESLSTEVLPTPVPGLKQRISKLPSKPRLIWAGRLAPEKRPLEFIKAVRRVEESVGATFQVDIYGEGMLTKQCLAIAKNSEVIKLHGSVSHKEVLDSMAKSSAVAVTSYGFETQGLTIAEALHVGRGVIYCDPHLGAGLSDGAGRLIGKSVSAMAKDLEELVKDKKSFEQMASKSADAVKVFSVDSYANKINRLYTQLLLNQSSEGSITGAKSE